jgi:tetratricopeptide (TPR) repeat protein
LVLAPAVSAAQGDAVPGSAFMDEPSFPTVREQENWFQSEMRRLRTYPRLDMALGMIELGNYQRARQEFQDYLSIDPDDLNVRYMYVVLLYELEDFDELLRQADMIIEASPEQSRPYLYRALAKQAAGRSEDAMLDFRKAADAPDAGEGDKRFALESIMESAVALQEWEKALDALEELRGLPGHADAFQDNYRAGILLEKLGRSEEAEAAYGKAQGLAEAEDEKLAADKALAFAALRRGDTKTAEKHLRSAYDRDPYDVEVLRGLAELHYGRGELHEAARYLEKAMEQEHRPRDTIFKAEIDYKLGKYESAAEALEKVLPGLRGADERRRVLLSLGTVYTSQGKPKEAAAAFREAFGASGPQEQADILVSLGNLHMLMGEPQQAAAHFRKAADLRPDTDTYRFLARALEASGKFDEAVEAQRVVMELDPSPEDRFLLGALQYRAGKPSRSFRTMNVALEEGLPRARAAEALRYRAFALTKAKRHLEAEAALVRALKANPTDADLYYALGETLLAVGKNEEAVVVLNHGLKLAGNRSAEQALGLALAKSGRSAEAAAVYERLYAEAAPGSRQRSDIAGALGNLYFDMGRFDDAAEAFTLAYKDSGRRSPQYLLQAARSAAAAERHADASALLGQVLKHPRLQAGLRLEALRELGFAALSAGNDELAEEALLAALKEKGLDNSRRAILHRTLGHLYARMGRHEEALECYERTAELDGDDPEFLLDMGYSLHALGRYDEAAEVFEQVLEEGESVPALLGAGRSYALMGKPGLAVDYLRRAEAGLEEAEPKERKLVLRELGMLYAGQEDWQESERWLRRYIDLGADAEAFLVLGRVLRAGGNTDEAAVVLQGIDPRDLPQQERGELADELVLVHLARKDFEKAADEALQALAFGETAERRYRYGLALEGAGRDAEAVEQFEAALAAADEDAYRESLAYGLARLNRFEEAAEELEVLAQGDPDYTAVYKDLAFFHRRALNNDRAVHWFKRTVDVERKRPTMSEAEEKEKARNLYALRREIHKIENTWDGTAYLSYAGGGVGSSNPPSGGSGGVPRGGGALELAYTPPIIGYRDDRILQAVGRINWNFESGSLAFDVGSYQGALGLRYKPIKTQNFKIGVERLFALGDDALDAWLFRALYSWEDGYDLKPMEKWWNYSFLYGEFDYFLTDTDRAVWAGELRQGATYNIKDRYLITPHLQAGINYWAPDGGEGGDDGIPSFVEGGPGVSFKYLFDESDYKAYNSSLELLFYYKWGAFLNNTPDDEDDAYGGIFTSIILNF